MTLANQITIGRILLIPFFVGAMIYYARSAQEGAPDESYRWWAIGFFLTAAISDALDGFLARRFDQRSELGAILDPLADKALLVAGLLTLSLADLPTLQGFPLWYLVLVLARDVLLVGGIGVLESYVREVKVAPHWTGKVSTALQMVAILWVLFDVRFVAAFWVVLAAGIFTGVSALIYFRRGYVILMETEDAKADSKREPKPEGEDTTSTAGPRRRRARDEQK